MNLQGKRTKNKVQTNENELRNSIKSKDQKVIMKK